MCLIVPISKILCWISNETKIPGTFGTVSLHGEIQEQQEVKKFPLNWKSETFWFVFECLMFLISVTLIGFSEVL